jgi:hypothetical protein
MRDPRAAQRLKLREKYGPELLELLLETIVPATWSALAPDHGFESLRCRLRFGQAELGAKAGMTQSRVSRIEGGANIRLGDWRRLYVARGFDLILLPVSRSIVEELEDQAALGRPENHYLYERARPRRRKSARKKAAECMPAPA